ncbi:O-antigen ligase like membrane protein [Marivirga sericea]|uniref:O-antigen ligase like membrane protein n=1 Tax=Marivirga sericea TaxID=1028 RepID=A0A1X7KL26_9BACT|nr:O-antigen ligase family protein [Marivirga sericea]SMG41737.1 O-antigen ligase like membrane protein [Marivirga sericea]
MKSINKSTLLLISTLVLIAIILPYLMVHISYLIAPMLILVLLTLFFVSITMVNYQTGMYLVFIYGCLFSLLSRLLGDMIPYGILYDLIILLTFIAMVIKVKSQKGFLWKTSEPIVIIQFIFYSYFLLQIANPNSVSIMAWFDAARFIILFLLFYVFIHLFKNKESIKNFTNLWILSGLIVAMYGVFQEYVGFRNFEYQWLTADPLRFQLYHIWGHIRIFSTLSDPSAYGLFLAFTGTGSLILAIGPGSFSKKSSYLGAALIMYFGMSFSGTRTAYAMILIGTVLFIIANLRNPKILIASFVLVMIFVILMVGPFYSGPINRMRSTFELSEDASMYVRDAKRIRLQSYVKSHPIGGGLNTAGNEGLRYSRGHPLAGFYSPDSGYLRTALEMGWIGLLIVISLNTAVVIKGIRNYFYLKDPQLKVYSMVYMVPFLGLSVAHYTQDALYQKPINILVMATFALMIKLKDVDTTLEGDA